MCLFCKMECCKYLWFDSGILSCVALNQRDRKRFRATLRRPPCRRPPPRPLRLLARPTTALVPVLPDSLSPALVSKESERNPVILTITLHAVPRSSTTSPCSFRCSIVGRWSIHSSCSTRNSTGSPLSRNSSVPSEFHTHTFSLFSNLLFSNKFWYGTNTSLVKSRSITMPSGVLVLMRP